MDKQNNLTFNPQDLVSKMNGIWQQMLLKKKKKILKIAKRIHVRQQKTHKNIMNETR